MRIRTAVVLAIVTLGTAGMSTAAAPTSAFPLRDGNRWLMENSATGSSSAIAVNRNGSGLVLRGFPGLGETRVRDVNGTVQAWDRANERWEPFLRLNAPVGTAYVVSLGGEPLWRNVKVVLSSRTARVDDATGKPRSGCIVLRLSPPKGVADAGIEELAFKPGVGLVRVVETTIAGPRERLLVSART